MDRNNTERQEFQEEFTLAVFQLLQFIGNDAQRDRPDFREWRLQRIKTIEKLDELREKLDKTCVTASYGKGVGIGATIAGDITTIIAAVMELRESSSAQNLMNIGNLVSHSGSLLEGASNAAESFVSEQYLSEIEEVLKRDQKLSTPLQDWLAFSRNMDANIREIFGCDLNFAIQNNVLNVFSEFIMLYNRSRDFQQTIDLMRRGSYSLDIGANVPIERLLRFSSQLEMDPKLQDNIREICSALAASSRTTQVVSEGVRVYRSLFGEENFNNRSAGKVGSHHSRTDPSPENPKVHENERVSGGSSELRALRSCNLEPPTVGEASAFCAFKANVENPSENLEDESSQVNYRQAIQQFPELVDNNALAQRQRPDTTQWRLQRVKTIKTLNELRKRLDLICVGASYGVGAGSGAQMSGTVTTIIGAVMALGKSPSAATVMKVGSLINRSGALVGGLSNIVESYVSAEYLKEVKAILDKDKELSEPLQEWLAYSKSLDGIIRTVFGSDLNSAVNNNVLKVFSEFATVYNSIKGFHATLDVMNKGQYAMHIGTDVKIDKLLKFSKELDVSPQLTDAVVKLSESYQLLQVGKDGLQIYQNLFGENTVSDEISQRNHMSMVSSDITDVLDDKTVEMPSNSAPLQAECPSVKAMSAFCAFQAIDIATSVVSFILAVMVIRDGKSKFSDALNQISDLLEAELESMVHFY